MTNECMKIDILQHELAQIPNSIFYDSGEICTAKSKSVLKNKLGVEVTARRQLSLETVITDAFAVLWILNWL